MKKILLLLFVSFSFAQSFSQSAITAAGAPIDYDIVNVRPEFPGGNDQFMNYVAKNFQFPEVDNPMSGDIVVRMFIGPDGKVSDVKVLKDLGEGTGKEAKRVLLSSPKWKPGEQDGKPITVVYEFPIKIRM